MTIGERIKKLREDRGYSQTDFAATISVSKQTLYKYENGIITNIPSDKIEAIANAFHVSPSVIMGWDSDEPAAPAESYYVDDKARELAESMHKNPEYSALFDAVRKVKPENLEIVKQIIEKFSENN